MLFLGCLTFSNILNTSYVAKKTTIFLRLASLICSHMFSALTAVMEVMVPEQPLVALHGRDATLNCSFTPTTTFNLSDLTVFWQLTDTKRSVHVYREGNDQLADQAESFMNRTSLFPTQLGLGNASLLLNRVGVADEGSYTCFVWVQDYGSAALLLQVAGESRSDVHDMSKQMNNNVEVDTRDGVVDYLQLGTT